MQKFNLIEQTRMWRTRRKWMVLIGLLLFAVDFTHAQDCSSNTFNFTRTTVVHGGISIQDFAKEIASHDVQNVVRVQAAAVDGVVLYISATYANGKLIISTTESFRDYAAKEISPTLLSQLAFTCTTGTRNIRYQVPIREENIYTPTFSRQEYEIVLPLPLPRAFDLMQYIDGGKGVVAHDYDLTKNNITFALAANEYFEVESVATASQKEFIARLKTKTTLTRIEEGLTIGISGTDEGNPPKTGTAVLKFSGDPTVIFIEPPQFQDSLYKITYKRDDPFTPVEVQLRADTFDNSVTFQLSGEDEQWFTVTPKDDRSSASVTLRPGVVIPESRQFASAIVTASRSNAAMDGRTAIVVEIEPVIKLVPAFEETSYGGEVGQNRAVTLPKAIKLVVGSVVGDVQLALSGNDGRYFTATSGDNGIQLRATDALTEDVLKDRFYFHFVIEARNVGNDQAGHAYVVLDVVKEDEIVPKFDQLYYEGSVTEEGILNDLVVAIPEKLRESTITYTGDTELFTILKEENMITFAPKDITEAKLVGKSYLLVKISAALDQIIVAETLVIVKIVRQTIVTPKFASNLLQGEVNERTSSLSAILVTVTPDTFNADTTTVSLVDSYGLFNLEQTAIPNEFTITLKNGFPIPSQSHFSLIVEATNPKSPKVHCFILIEVNRNPTPQFEQLLYEGLINSSNELQDLKLKLTPDTYDNSIFFTLVDNDADMFQITKLPSTELQITLADPGVDVTNRNNLRFNMRATRGDLVATVPVVVFIQKAEVKLPKFEKPLYKSTIGTDLQLVTFEAIRLVAGTEAEGMNVLIHLNNSDLFKASLVGLELSVALKETLVPTDIEGHKRFEFVVEAENPGVGSGFTTIIIDILIVVPEFTAASYGGTVNEGSTDITFSEAVALKADTATPTVQYDVTGEDARLIDHQVQADGSLKFTLKDTGVQLKDKSQINFVAQATNTGSPTASAALVVRIIRPIPIVFTKTSFTGVLLEGVSIANFSTDNIEFVQNTLLEGASLSLTGPNSNLLEVAITAEKVVQISLRTTTNWNQIRFIPYLTFFLQASNPGSPSSSCTIILNVKNRDIATPRFTKSFYRGTLQPDREVTFAATDVITLQPDTITTTLTFRVVENDYDMFQITRVVDKFQVALKETVTQESIKDRDLFSFMIEANNEFGETDTTTVLISAHVEEIITPMFKEAIYRGSIQEGSTEVQIGDITFVAGTAGENIEVGADRGDSSWFDVAIVQSKVMITTRVGVTIPWNTIVDREFLNFRIQATNPGSDPATAFVVLDIVRTTVLAPKFKSSTFQGSLEVGSNKVQFPEEGLIEFEAGSLLPGFTLTLVDNDHEMFEAKVNGNQVDVTLKEKDTENDWKDKNYLRFSVTVSNLGSLSVKADVVVDLKRVPLVTPLFEKHNYNGAIGTDFRLNLVEPIRVSEDTFSEDVVIEVIESSSNLLRITQNQREVIVQLAKQITSDDLQGLRNLHFTIEAKSSNELSSVCFLLISLPDDETCIDPKPPTVDCTECHDCTTGQPQDDTPVFPYGNYRFFLKSDQTGLVGLVKASTKNPSIVLQHVSNIEDAYLKARLSYSTDGILRIQQSLDPANYKFQATALNAQAGKQSTVDVLLDVTQDLECPAEPGLPKNRTVERSLVIESLQEESPHLNIFPSQLGECEYQLIGEKPLLDNGYFSIDSTTHWLTARAFDRENSQLFGDMVIPQFQLRLRLVCASQAIRSKRSLIETDELNYARDVTVLNVIVEDINDNSPSFVYPVQGQHFGFPNPAIAAEMLLPELITIVATDLDEGLNAKVRFSLDENNDFGIDAELGRIYPLMNAMKASQLVELVVNAADRNGATDSRISTMKISVHRLEEDNMVMLNIPGGVDEMGLMDQINSNGDRIRVQTLIQAIIPSTDSQQLSRTRASTEEFVRRLVVYAFNGSNELQDTDTIQRIIRSSTLPVAVTTDTFSNGCFGTQNAQCGESSTSVGLIVAASILGALFLISTGLAIFLYLRFVRPLNAASTNPSDVVQLENDFDISPPPSPPTLGAKKVDESSPEARKTSIHISGITEQESEDSRFQTGRLAANLNDKLDSVDEYGSVSSRVTLEEPPPESRNVKFNELVERIEVVEHHPGGGEDNDSSYNERF